MSDHRDPRRHETQSISGSGHPRTSRVSDDWRHESRRPVIHSDPSDGSRTQPKPHGFSPTSPSRSADAHTTIDPGNSRSNATRRHSVYRYKSSLPDTISKSRVQEQYRPSPPPDTVRNRGRSSDSATSSRYPPSHKRSRSDSAEGRQDRVESVGPRDRNFQRAPVSGPTLSAGATSAALSKLGTATSPPYSSDQASTLWTEKTPDAWGFTCRHMGLGRIFYFPANSTVDDVLRLCPLIHTDVASNGANSYILVMDSTCGVSSS